MKHVFAVACLAASCFVGVGAQEISRERMEACVDSIRPQLKDPESAKLLGLVGTRGMDARSLGGTLWIRYKATNSYGGYVSRYMLCPTRERDPVQLGKLIEMLCHASLMQHLADVSLERLLRLNAPDPFESKEAFERRMRVQGRTEAGSEVDEVLYRSGGDLSACRSDAGKPRPEPEAPSSPPARPKASTEIST